MKRRLQGILAAAAAAAVIAGAGVAQADGMPRVAAAAVYDHPAVWSGAYIGVESGWDFEDHGAAGNRDVLGAGLYLGYQRQYGNIVAGLEVNLIGTEFAAHEADSGRIQNIFTVGPRLGWVMGDRMPYLTGGFASGGVSEGSSYSRQDGWYLGGGVDMKLAPYAVVGLDYKHIDFGNVSSTSSSTSGSQSVTSDQIMLRMSLFLGAGGYEAPLK